MTIFWKSAAGILVAVVLVLALGKKDADIALLLTMAVCCMAAAAAFSVLEPILDFLYRLAELGNFQFGMMGTLLKILGVALVSELVGMICQDAGNTSLARGMQLLGTAVMMELSLPIFETLLDLVQNILGEL